MIFNNDSDYQYCYATNFHTLVYYEKPLFGILCNFGLVFRTVVSPALQQVLEIIVVDIFQQQLDSRCLIYYQISPRYSTGSRDDRQR